MEIKIIASEEEIDEIDERYQFDGIETLVYEALDAELELPGYSVTVEVVNDRTTPNK